jgi:hypothetical protein
VEGLAESGFGKARDSEFRNAIEQAKTHFHRCAKCFQYVCDAGYNRDSGLCLKCAPDTEMKIEAARAQGKVYAAGEKAALEGIQRGKKMDVKRERQLVCPECDKETHGAKFCPEYGFKMAAKTACPACSAEVSPGAKFCRNAERSCNMESFSLDIQKNVLYKRRAREGCGTLMGKKRQVLSREPVFK